MDSSTYNEVLALMTKLENLARDSDIRPKPQYQDMAKLPIWDNEGDSDLILVVTSKSVDQLPFLSQDKPKRFVSLRDALSHLIWCNKKMEEVSLLRGCTEVNNLDGLTITIVVDEGIYVDNIPPFEWPPLDNVSLSIIGIGHVVFVYLFEQIVLRRWNFSISNVIMLAQAVDTEVNTVMIDALDGAKVVFTDVRLIAPSISCPLSAEGQGSEVSMSKCSFSDCRIAFFLDWEAKLEMTDCHVRPTTQFLGTVREKSSIAISRSSFADCGELRVRTKCSVRMEKCSFRQDSRNRSSQPHLRRLDALDLMDSTAVIRDSEFFGYRLAIVAQKHSDVKLFDSQIECAGVFQTERASNIMAKGNQFRSQLLLLASFNTDGRVTFKKNRMLDGTPPKFQFDDTMPELIHDFAEVITTHFDSAEVIREGFPTKKERAKFREEICGKSGMTTSTGILDNERIAGNFKACSKCGEYEHVKAAKKGPAEYGDADGGKAVDKKGNKGKKKTKKREQEEQGAGQVEEFVKFKYCTACKRVCYCSRKCQVEDWPDHKIICKILRK